MTANNTPKPSPITRRALLSASGALLLTSCGVLNRLSPPAAAPTVARGTSTDVPHPGGTLRIAQVTDIVPAGAPNRLSGANVHLLTLVYDTLVSYDADLTPRPRLATAWEWSPDFLRLRLTLRSGVTFHSGRAFTSEDAKFNLESLRDPAIGSQWRNYANLMQVSAPDPTTLVISFDRPLKASFDVLSAAFMADPQAIGDTAAGPGFSGTGPFRLQDWQPGDHVALTRNPLYWQPGKPYLDAVELRVMPDQQAALAALESGTIDWVSGVNGQDAHRLQSDADYQVILMNAGFSFFYVGLDLAVPALAEQRVRQAFNYALNRQAMVSQALTGMAERRIFPGRAKHSGTMRRKTRAIRSTCREPDSCFSRRVGIPTRACHS